LQQFLSIRFSGVGSPCLILVALLLEVIEIKKIKITVYIFYSENNSRVGTCNKHITSSSIRF
jgi:hypothetical protein